MIKFNIEMIRAWKFVRFLVATRIYVFKGKEPSLLYCFYCFSVELYLLSSNNQTIKRRHQWFETFCYTFANLSYKVCHLSIFHFKKIINVVQKYWKCKEIRKTHFKLVQRIHWLFSLVPRLIHFSSPLHRPPLPWKNWKSC